MTGFGRGSAKVGEISVNVEIRALNSRQTDIRLKAPQLYREEEVALRNLLQSAAHRGKFDVSIERKDSSGGDVEQGINDKLFHRYRAHLLRLTPEMVSDPAGLTTAILRLPNVVGSIDDELEPKEQQALHEAFSIALYDFIAFRTAEGKVLEADLITNVNAISEAIPAVEQHEAIRQNKMKARLQRLIEENLSASAVDQNRLEQEVVYYLEKIDISEEKVRLAQHCSYFIEKLQDDDPEKGRRLNFIAQEMGREINTLGAKAYSSEIQRLVVGMKDGLEKIKEQIANIV